jgi:uncharacterized repeat protein (TIGR02543 family)
MGTNYPIESSYSTNATVILYAKWTANNYTVAFQPEGGAPSPSIVSVTYGQHYGTLPIVTRDGYIFDGWFTEADDTGTKVESTTTVSIASNHTLYAKWTVTVGGIGQAGGYVFYDDEIDGIDNILGYRYLEAAPAGWNGTDDDPVYCFGYYRPEGTNITVGTETDIGTGISNTTMLVEKMGNTTHNSAEGTSTAIYAAKVCTNYQGGGFTNWFLPSKDELLLMYQNLSENSLAGFSDDSRYWSSSEFNFYHAWYQIIRTVFNQNYYGRDSNYKVRPVRAF